MIIELNKPIWVSYSCISMYTHVLCSIIYFEFEFEFERVGVNVGGGGGGGAYEIDFWASKYNRRVSQMRAPLAACCEPVVS